MIYLISPACAYNIDKTVTALVITTLFVAKLVRNHVHRNGNFDLKQ